MDENKTVIVVKNTSSLNEVLEEKIDEMEKKGYKNVLIQDIRGEYTRIIFSRKTHHDPGLPRRA